MPKIVTKLIEMLFTADSLVIAVIRAANFYGITKANENVIQKPYLAKALGKLGLGATAKVGGYSVTLEFASGGLHLRIATPYGQVKKPVKDLEDVEAFQKEFEAILLQAIAEKEACLEDLLEVLEQVYNVVRQEDWLKPLKNELAIFTPAVAEAA